MKNQITHTIAKLTVTVVATLVVSSAQANECSNSPSALRDTQDMANKIALQLGLGQPQIVKVSANGADDLEAKKDAAILDMKIHKIDRSTPGFKLFDAVGVVKKKGNDWGSGFLISRCHVLTARHVPEEADQETDPSTGRSKIALKHGDVFNFSVGQTAQCDGSNQFKHNSQGKVVAFGDDRSASKDWAIIKLSKPVDASIRPLRVSNAGFFDGQKVVRAGFPGVAVGDGNFQNVYAQYIQVERMEIGSGLVNTNEKRHFGGFSGGPAIALESDGRSLGGVAVGMNVSPGKFLTMASIMNQLSKGDINQKVSAEIDRANQTGNCD